MKLIEFEKVTLNNMQRLKIFVNTLTADDKYSRLSRKDSMRTIQRHLPKKLKNFSEFFFAFSKSESNF